MISYTYIGAFLILVLISSFSQIILKLSANEDRKGLKIYFNRKVICAYCIYFSVIFFCAILYRHIPLSIGTLLDSAGYAFVLILSAIFLKEKITACKLIGAILIIAGIFTCIL